MKKIILILLVLTPLAVFSQSWNQVKQWIDNNSEHSWVFYSTQTDTISINKNYYRPSMGDSTLYSRNLSPPELYGGILKSYNSNDTAYVRNISKDNFIQKLLYDGRIILLQRTKIYLYKPTPNENTLRKFLIESNMIGISDDLVLKGFNYIIKNFQE